MLQIQCVSSRAQVRPGEGLAWLWRAWAGLLLLLCLPAGAAEREVRFDTLSKIRASVPAKAVGDTLDLRLTRAATCILPLAGVRTLRFVCEVEGYLELECTAIPATADKSFRPPQAYTEGTRLVPGVNRCAFDLRRSPHWQSDSLVLLSLEGTGTVRLRDLKADFLEPEADAQRERARAMFWAPLRLGHTTINLLPAVYCDPGRRYSWTLVWGCVTAGVLVLVALLGWLWRPLRGPRTLAYAALGCLLLYQGQWLCRFVPALHLRPLVSEEEKIRDHYFSQELGLLIRAARQHIPAEAKTIVAGQKTDWFGKQALAFNLAPRLCGYRRDRARPGCYRGLSRAYTPPVLQKEADYWISYYGDVPLPGAFTKVYELNPHVYIARRQVK